VSLSTKNEIESYSFSPFPRKTPLLLDQQEVFISFTVAFYLLEMHNNETIALSY